MKLEDSMTEFLIYLAPSLLVFGMAYFLVKKFLDTDRQIKMAELKRAMQKDLLPLRLQAYERIILYMERISPNNLLIRVYQPGMSVGEFHKDILSTIRSEYEHNLTQQVYVTNAAWEIVRKCRDEVLSMVNKAYESCDGNAPGAELSKKVFGEMMQTGVNPVHVAIDQIKNEAHALF